MNKAYLWVAVGVIVVGVGAYIAMGRAGNPAPAGEQAATSTPATLRELAASQAPQKCTFTSANNAQGTVYVASGKVRSDFSAEVSGKAVAGHAIVVDNTAYAWMDGSAQGFKNSFDLAATSTATTSMQGMSPDERVSYSCEPWIPDQGQFALPAGITFMTVSEIQAKAGAGALGASCSQCDMIPDATAKAQCKAALRC